MKQSQICPKCGSTDVIWIAEATRQINDNGNHIYCGIFTYATINRYICCDCGYTEEYVNKSEIQKVRNYYNK